MKIVRNLLLALLVIINVVAAFHAAGFTYYYAPDIEQPGGISKGKSFSEKVRIALLGYRHHKTAVSQTPAFPFETINMSNELGQNLEVWRARPLESKGTVILCHGHGDNKSDLLREAGFFYKNGFGVVLFDFRAHGNSEGNVTTLGFKETRDLLVVYDFVLHSGEKNILLWGRSMGASTILKAISEFGLKPQRVILECPFATMYDAVGGKLAAMGAPKEPATSMLMMWGSIIRSVWMFGYRPVDYAQALTMPVLLCWGANDRRVSEEETSSIYRNLASRQKQLLVFRNSAHESYLNHDRSQWEDAMKRFIAQ